MEEQEIVRLLSKLDSKERLIDKARLLCRAMRDACALREQLEDDDFDSSTHDLLALHALALCADHSSVRQSLIVVCQQVERVAKIDLEKLIADL